MGDPGDPFERDTSFTVEVGGGRRLGGAVYGDPAGTPVLYNSGLPTCRQEAGIFAHEGARRAGVKLISLERPGYGLSDPLPGQSLAGWADDVAAAADRLGLERFHVVGLSGGGPFALACAARLPSRVIRAAVVSGLGPLDAEVLPPSQLFRLLRFMAPRPTLSTSVYGLLAWLGRRWGDLALRLLTLQMPPLDRAVCRRPGIWSSMRRFMLTEPFRSGVGRAVEETALYARPWGFRLADIEVEVDLWHGERDLHVPVDMGRSIARGLKRCAATFVPEAGHLLIADHGEAIFRALIRRGAGRS